MKKTIKKLAELCDMEASTFVFASAMAIIIVGLLILFGLNYK